MSKAQLVETVERDGVKVLVYDNGMERNADTGRMIKPPTDTLITAENSTDFHRVRREMKYARAQAGANRALTALRNRKFENGKWIDEGPVWENPQDLDYVEAIAEAQAAQALLVGDPSSTKAANWVMTHTGVAEVREDGGSLPAASLAAAAINYETAQIMARVWSDIQAAQLSTPADAQIHETIDGETLEE